MYLLFCQSAFSAWTSYCPRSNIPTISRSDRNLHWILYCLVPLETDARRAPFHMGKTIERSNRSDGALSLQDCGKCIMRGHMVQKQSEPIPKSLRPGEEKARRNKVGMDADEVRTEIDLVGIVRRMHVPWPTFGEWARRQEDIFSARGPPHTIRRCSSPTVREVVRLVDGGNQGAVADERNP